MPSGSNRWSEQYPVRNRFSGQPPCDDEYYWNIAPHSRKLKEKADYIRKHGKWELVRSQYLDLKNLYLTRNDHNHPSFICYIEAVNNVYNSRKHW